LARHGDSSSILTCRLNNGEGHAFLISGEGVLDNRFGLPVPYGQSRGLHALDGGLAGLFSGL
jgi:hypothetical protein